MVTWWSVCCVNGAAALGAPHDLRRRRACDIYLGRSSVTHYFIYYIYEYIYMSMNIFFYVCFRVRFYCGVGSVELAGRRVSCIRNHCRLYLLEAIPFRGQICVRFLVIIVPSSYICL